MAFGALVAGQLSKGEVIALSGDLGSGKTQFVKGVARALGFTGKVHSPTFAILNEYRTGRWPLFHLDLYRLETAPQVLSAGIEEYLVAPQGVTLIEWPERLKLINFDISMKWVCFSVLSETERRIEHDFGT
ncbi:MAG: tRNA (adenosine(37)-N6)-threonylcarbamoyltransferase complex ATPase subunit type 1 TsaE [Verrucomicrobiota bacterium]|nr:tRNA (adenosine(37)-N6)-threonylcarbamoyltransferase complex ATPase subunit type 1 TsaE [Verrucomicrobiota bacterium]